MSKYEQIWHEIKPTRWLIKFNLTGLPSVIGRSKTKVFAEVKERVGKKLAGWKVKMLSMGGKEVLIKVVAQAVPTYTMS